MISQILAAQKQIQQKNFDFNTYHQNCLAKLKAHAHYNAIINYITNYPHIPNHVSPLNKIMYAVKDNINVLDTITTGGSLFFENFKSPYNATIIQLLNQTGAIPVCKANMDEFGLGGTGLFSAYQNVINPFDAQRISGGSSSGCAVLVALKLVHFALATDTGDSIRLPASYLNIYGFKPTYGLVSRYGVFPYSPSLDHVGVLANSVSDIALVMDVIQAHDPNDFTSQPQKMVFYANLKNKIKTPKIAFYQNIIDLLPQTEKTLFHHFITKLQKKYQIKAIHYPFKLLKSINLVYKILSYAEAVSCYQNIMGINFGKKGEGKDFISKIKDTRSKNFGNELKKRFVIGAYCTLDQNYHKIFLKVKKIRRLIVEAAEKDLQKYTFILMPASYSIAPKISELIKKPTYENIYNDYLQIANFGGFPSLSMPNYFFQQNPIGLNIMANLNQDVALLNFAYQLQKIIYDKN